MAELSKSKAKKQRTPNTTQGKSRIAVTQNLQQFDMREEEEGKVRQRDNMRKEMEAATSALTEWEKLVAKRKQTAEKNQTTIDTLKLWKVNVAGTFTKAERQCILKICVPNSGVLSKDEKEHIRTFENNNGAYARMKSEVHQ